MDASREKRRYQLERHPAAGHDLDRRRVFASQLHQLAQHAEAGGTVRAAATGEHPVYARLFQPAQCFGRISAGRQGGIERPVERDLGGGFAPSGGFRDPAEGRNVRSAVRGQHADHYAGGPGLHGGTNVTFDDIQIVTRVAEVAGPWPHQDVDGEANPAGLFHHADARRDALRPGQGRAQLNADSADGGSKPHAVGVLHGKLQLWRESGRGGHPMAHAQSPCQAGFRPNVSM